MILATKASPVCSCVFVLWECSDMFVPVLFVGFNFLFLSTEMPRFSHALDCEDDQAKCRILDRKCLAFCEEAGEGPKRVQTAILHKDAQRTSKDFLASSLSYTCLFTLSVFSCPRLGCFFLCQAGRVELSVTDGVRMIGQTRQAACCLDCLEQHQDVCSRYSPPKPKHRCPQEWDMERSEV